MEIKTNHMVVITPKMNLLQIPIKDKFYLPPSDPAALKRDTDFAQEKGLFHPQARQVISAIADVPTSNGLRRLPKAMEPMACCNVIPYAYQ